MEYIWNIDGDSDCPACTDAEREFVKFIKEVMNNYDGYNGERYIVRMDDGSYRLSIEDNLPTENFEWQFGIKENIFEEMDNYARLLRSRILYRTDLIADVSIDEAFLCVSVQFPLNIDAERVNELVAVCDEFFQEQFDKRNKVTTDFSRDSLGHLVKADVLSQICFDIIDKARQYTEVDCRVSEYNQRDPRDGIKVDIHRDRDDFYVVYVGTCEPFIENICETSIFHWKLQERLARTFGKSETKVFLRIIK